jgi:hypothetical protein
MQWLSVAGGFKVQPSNLNFQVYYATGTKKPFLFYTKSWMNQISERLVCQVLGNESGHCVMADRRGAFKQDVIKWLSKNSSSLRYFF